MTTTVSSIPVTRIKQSRLSQVDFNNLEFGRYIADHMIISDYKNGKWNDPYIIPFSDLPMSPAMLSLHYGQSVFEGMKAFHMQDGAINIFRPYKHHVRLNKSLARMCMPQIPEELFVQSLQAIIETDKEWVPKQEGSSLYIRPLVFASEARLGVKVADEYKFIVMNSPVALYQSKPYRLKVEDYFVRTAEGGTGFAKCAGNYGGAFYPSHIAREQGFDQILWTDYKEHKYIDEVGMMNVIFIIDNKLVTPQLNTAILDGITRDSILTLARDMNFPVEEKRLSVAELVEGFNSGKLTEAFGAGTAAVVAPIATIHIQGKDYHVPAPTEQSFQSVVKRKLHDIRVGKAPDVHEWNYIVR